MASGSGWNNGGAAQSRQSTIDKAKSLPDSSPSPSLGRGRIAVISSGRDAKVTSANLMKKVESTNGNSKGKQREVVDLTISDGEEEEEDLIVVNEYPICIGQITSLALILYPLQELNIPPIEAVGVLHGTFLPVHIYRGVKSTVGNETLKLLTPQSQQVFGMVEHKMANILGPLLGNGYSGTGVTKGSEGKVWCEAAVVRRPERNPMMLTLTLLLYALPHNIQFVANTLEAALIFLENPPNYIPAHHFGYAYSNPHNPAAGVSGRGEAERRRARIASGLMGESTGMVGMVKGPRSVEVQRDQVNKVFDNLKSGVDLDECEPHPMITTKLYPHQKQALSFLLDRETIHPVDKVKAGEPQPILSLWQRQVDTYNRPTGWISIVTDLEIKGASAPIQCRGSILADSMGVGKSIVVISLIAATLEIATEWAKLKPEKEYIDERFEEMVLDKTKAKATTAEFATPIYGMDPALAKMSGGFSSNSAAPAAATSKKKQAKEKREKKREDYLSSRFNRLVTRTRATLIVCPLSTVQNWESQIDEHVNKPGRKTFTVGLEGEIIEDENQVVNEEKGLSVYIYHGNGRTTDPSVLADYDVVITTFSTLGTEFSKQCRAEDERDAEKEAANNSDDDLVLYDADGSIVKKLAAETLPESKKRRRKKIDGDGASPLQQVQWFRVVLDEAHIIKEHTTIQARAACELSASRRTALSGTPLQNSLNDIYSLIRFLRLEPFTDRATWTQHIGALAKSGDALGVSRLQLIMRHLALRRTKDSLDKFGKRILDLPPNNQTLVSLEFGPAEYAFYSSHHARYKHDFEQLVKTDTVMKNYCSILQELLRLRQICVHMALVRDAEDGAAGDLIKSIVQNGISKSRAVQLISLMKEAGGVYCSECGLDILPNNGGLVKEETLEEDKKPIIKKKKVAPKSAPMTEDDSNSSITSAAVSSVITRCQHIYCKPCFKVKVCPKGPASLEADDRVACSICTAVLTRVIDIVELGGEELEKALLEVAEGEIATGKKGKKVTRVLEHSTKTQALVRDLFPFSQANPTSANYWGGMDSVDPDELPQTIGFQPVKGVVVKSVVFSQWTKLLDRVGDALDDSKIKFDRLDGSMQRDTRTKAMEAFRLDPACEILLVSIRAGGVGLNLTAGRRVYLLEPSWNPAIEHQAVDRIHRLGQTLPVQTVRFVIAKSIETQMLKIQKRKNDLADMSLGQTQTKAQVAKQRLEDLKAMYETDV